MSLINSISSVFNNFEQKNQNKNNIFSIFNLPNNYLHSLGLNEEDLVVLIRQWLNRFQVSVCQLCLGCCSWRLRIEDVDVTSNR